MSRINLSGGIVSPGEGAPIDPARGTRFPNASGQPRRSVDLAPSGGQLDAGMRPRRTLPVPSLDVPSQGGPMMHQLHDSRPNGEILAQAAEVYQAPDAPQAHHPTLRELMDQERLAERSQRAE